MQLQTSELKQLERNLDITEANLEIIDQQLEGEQVTGTVEFRRFLHEAMDELYRFRRSVHHEIRSREIGG